MSRARKTCPVPKPAKPVAEVDALTIINANAAGIDIGLDEMWVSVRADRDPEPVRPFGMNTPDLLAVAEWLKVCGVETVAMESTGVYWIPLYEILEARGFNVYLVNARHANAQRASAGAQERRDRCPMAAPPAYLRDAQQLFPSRRGDVCVASLYAPARRLD